jgi:hypothetical protein
MSDTYIFSAPINTEREAWPLITAVVREWRDGGWRLSGAGLPYLDEIAEHPCKRERLVREALRLKRLLH